MILTYLLYNSNFVCTYGTPQIEITNIENNSNKIKAEGLFFAVKGYESDGHIYIQKAIENGAKAIIYSDYIENFIDGVTYIRVKDVRRVMSEVAARFYSHDRDITVIGITGTNGKTTSTYMLKHLLETVGSKVGLIGTIANYIGDRKIETERTTPDAIELFKLIKEMKEESCDYCIMEVSSHSVVLDRIHGLEFEYGIFTNLTQDHLDFHKTFEDYYNAKFKFIKNVKHAVINIDDSYGQNMILDTNEFSKSYRPYNGESCSYGVRNGYVTAKNLSLTADSSTFDLVVSGKTLGRVTIHIPGLYNVYNALGVISVLTTLKMPNQSPMLIKDIVKGLDSMKSVDGRCEKVYHDKLQATVIVDYAHTPDGLENILKAVKAVSSGRIITVFGCGGNRDKGKRPLMGGISTQYSDFSIVTSDNPRHEDPLDIINDVKVGMNGNYTAIVDRKEAIEYALTMLNKGDVLVIAGKGHENYQVIGNEKIHSDDREIVRNYLDSL